MKFDRDDQAFPAHFLDETMFRAQRIDPFHQLRAHFRGALDQIFLIDHFERGETAGHREIIPAECS